MTELCLVRHGQTDWNFQEIIQGREDIPLNALGHRQAEESAAFLSQESWDVIVASPLSRAVDTARYIAEACGIDAAHIIQDERFIEREFGAASGKPVPGIYEAVQADDQLVGQVAAVGKLLVGRAVGGEFRQQRALAHPGHPDQDQQRYLGNRLPTGRDGRADRDVGGDDVKGKCACGHFGACLDRWRSSQAAAPQG